MGIQCLRGSLAREVIRRQAKKYQLRPDGGKSLHGKGIGTDGNAQPPRLIISIFLRCPGSYSPEFIASNLSSEYRSLRPLHAEWMQEIRASSSAPLLIRLLRSQLLSAKRHITSLPSAVSLARVHPTQNGSVTDAITPTFPMPSRNW